MNVWRIFSGIGTALLLCILAVVSCLVCLSMLHQYAREDAARTQQQEAP